MKKKTELVQVCVVRIIFVRDGGEKRRDRRGPANRGIDQKKKYRTKRNKRENGFWVGTRVNVLSKAR